MSKQTSNEKIEAILNTFRQSSIIIHSKGSVRGVDEDIRAFRQSLEQAHQAIATLLVKARLDEISKIFGEAIEDERRYNMHWFETHISIIKDRIAELNGGTSK